MSRTPAAAWRAAREKFSCRDQRIHLATASMRPSGVPTVLTSDRPGLEIRSLWRPSIESSRFRQRFGNYRRCTLPAASPTAARRSSCVRLVDPLSKTRHQAFPASCWDRSLRRMKEGRRRSRSQRSCSTPH